jgi:dsRNA-specific ribonuclease
MENQESYSVISNNLNKILSSLKIENFSLLDIYPENNYLLSDFISDLEPKIKDIVSIGKIDFDFPGDKKLFSPEEWENNMAVAAERFKNAIVIFNRWKVNKLDFNKIMNLFSTFFPIIFILSDDKLDKAEDWRLKELKNNVYLYINNNIRNFTSFRIDNFKDISTVKITSSGYNIEEEIKIELEPSKEPAVTRRRANEFDLSIFDNLPLPTITPDRNSKTFIQEFYSYLKILISRILPKGKETMLPYLLNKKTIYETWIPAFTHKLIDPSRTKNYETLETIGDNVQAYTLFIYYTDRYPEANQQDLTNIKQEVLKKESQGAIGKAMKLLDWAFMPVQLRSNLEIGEDLFESFTGALDTILNKKSTTIGQSSNLIYYLYKKMFDNYDFKKELIGPTRNFVEQLVEQIKFFVPPQEKTFPLKNPNRSEIPQDVWEEIIEKGNQILKDNDIMTPLSIHGMKNKGDKGVIMKTFPTADNKIKTQIIMTPFGSKTFFRYGVKIKENTIIGEAIEPTRRPSEGKAWMAARNFLLKKGIDEKWRDRIKIKKVRDNLDEEKYALALLKAKDKNKNIVEITITRPKGLKKDDFYQITGLDKNMNKYILSTFVSDDNQRDNFALTLDKFIEE